MPGIAGMIIRESCAADGPRAVRAMITVMASEPFYISGMYSVPEMGIHAGWVAPESSFAASQVLVNEQHDIALLFSGECCLESQTGPELQRNGHNIGKDKATWLVHLYEEQGAQFFRNLNGVFSGLLIDKRHGKAFLFNDRYGIERIYWCETKNAFYFSSEAKALLRILPELRRFDERGVAQFLTYGCPLEERTLFQGISLLPGGALWTFQNGTYARHKYFSPENWESQVPMSVEGFDSAFQETFGRILPRYLECNFKLGISLTAGLDTRMIMACLPESGVNAVCYTYSGQASDTLDARLAARVAGSCGLEHRILRLEPSFFENFAAWADKTVYATDGYFGITGAHEIYLSRLAHDLSPLRLTGVSGGEILRGVSTFKSTNLSTELLQPEMRLLTDSLAEKPSAPEEHPVTFAAFKEIPSSLFGALAACRSQLCLRSPYLDNELVALAYRAPLSVRESCESAVRFVRKKSRTMSEIPTDMGYLGTSGLNFILRRLGARFSFKVDYFNNAGLPHWLAPMNPLFWKMAAVTGMAGTHKYIHYRSWFKLELAAYLNEALTDAQTRRSPFWNANFLKQMAKEHLSGRKNYLQEINAVLTLEAIERLLFANVSHKGEEFINRSIKDGEAVSAR